MRFQDLPADPEKYKTVRDSKGKIIKATNDAEFQKENIILIQESDELKKIFSSIIEKSK